MGREQLKQNEKRLFGQSGLFVHVFKHTLSMVITVFIYANPRLYMQRSDSAKRTIVKVVVTVLQALFPAEKPDVFTMCEDVANKHLYWNEAYQPFSCSVKISKNPNGDLTFVPPSKENMPQYMTLKGFPLREIIICALNGYSLQISKEGGTEDVNVAEFINQQMKIPGDNIDTALKIIHYHRIRGATSMVSDLPGSAEFGRLHTMELQYGIVFQATSVDALALSFSNLTHDDPTVDFTPENNTGGAEEQVAIQDVRSWHMRQRAHDGIGGAGEHDESLENTSPEYNTGGAEEQAEDHKERRWPLRRRPQTSKFEIVHTRKNPKK